MKKLIALILAVLMVLSMTACADKNDVRGDVVSGDNGSSATDGKTPEEKEFGTGKSSGNKYVNEFMDISCELGSEWKFLTDAEIRKNNETALGLMGDDYAEAIKNASTFTDMMATHSNQTDTVNITFEKLTGANLALSEEQYVNLSKDSLKGSLESMGMTNVVLNTGKDTFAGKEHPYIAVTAQYNGVAVYERLVAVKNQNYVAVVVVCTWKTNTTKNILDAFKAV